MMAALAFGLAVALFVTGLLLWDARDDARRMETDRDYWRGEAYRGDARIKSLDLDLRIARAIAEPRKRIDTPKDIPFVRYAD